MLLFVNKYKVDLSLSVMFKDAIGYGLITGTITHHLHTTNCTEWMNDCCLMPTQQFFSSIVREVTSNEMMMSALYYPNIMTWFFIGLAHWNNSLQVKISLHSDTLSWFHATQSLLLLLNAACFTEEQEILFL